MQQLYTEPVKYFQLQCQIKFSLRMFNYGSYRRWRADFSLTNNFFLHAFFVWDFVTDLLPNRLAVFLFYFFAFFARYLNTFFFRVWDAFLFVLHFTIFLWFSFTLLLFNADCFGFLTTNSRVCHFTRFLGNSFALQFLDITALFSRNIFTFFLVNLHTFLSRHAFAVIPLNLDALFSWHIFAFIPLNFNALFSRHIFAFVSLDLNTFLLSFFFIFPFILVLRLFRFVVYFFGKLVKFFNNFLYRSLYLKIIILVIFKILLE